MESNHWEMARTEMMIYEVISRLERLERSITRVAMLHGSLSSFTL